MDLNKKKTNITVNGKVKPLIYFFTLNPTKIAKFQVFAGIVLKILQFTHSLEFIVLPINISFG